MKSIPSDIQNIVESALMLIRLQDKARALLAIRALALLTVTKSPLTAETLCHVMGMSLVLDHSKEVADLIEDDIPDPTAIVDCCMGLIAVDSVTSTVTLAPYDIGQYMRQNWDKIFKDALTKAKVARWCVAYLSLDVFSNGPHREVNDLRRCLHQYAFLDYASRHWGHHAREALSPPSSGEEILNDIDRILGKTKRSNLELSLQICELSSETRGSLGIAGDLPIQVLNIDKYQTVSSLQVAARFGLTTIVENILEISPDKVSESDSCGTTALHLSAMSGWIDTVNVLLDAGACPTRVNEEGKLPLHYAAGAGHVDVIKILMKHTVMDGSNDTSHSGLPIQQAARYGHRSVVSISEPKSSPADLEKALCHAVEAGHTSVIEYLIDEAKVSPDATIDGISAMLLAVKAGNSAALRLLCNAGGSTTCRNGTPSGRIPLHQAIRSGSLGLARILLKFGADLGVRDDRGRIVLFETLNPPDISAASFLLKRGVDIMSCNDTGENIMHEAVKKGAFKHVSLFLDQGLKFDMRNGQGETPLDIAIQYNKPYIKDLLVRSEADHNTRRW